MLVLGLVIASQHPRELENILGFDVFHHVRMIARDLEYEFDRIVRAL
ncbi:hypothetical protein JCM19239_5375 [Vibrio variabilis]|uniref:Uncharacterized protein n=1 Tax=Vibrio variabilis TaxID=990271 RepID=A0ABQ0JE44_9VIBR|nr:hypothetical protein JCM19239_5375 [Vibrio variabilis]